MVPVQLLKKTSATAHSGLRPWQLRGSTRARAIGRRNGGVRELHGRADTAQEIRETGCGSFGYKEGTEKPEGAALLCTWSCATWHGQSGARARSSKVKRKSTRR
jgi:hypothetical protein